MISLSSIFSKRNKKKPLLRMKTVTSFFIKGIQASQAQPCMACRFGQRPINFPTRAFSFSIWVHLSSSSGGRYKEGISSVFLAKFLGFEKMDLVVGLFEASIENDKSKLQAFANVSNLQRLKLSEKPLI